MKHCCVVGGSGFIGSYLVLALVESGRFVTVVGRKPAPSHPLPDGIRYLSGDYNDIFLLRQVLVEADEVVHLAYSTVPKTSFEDPVHDILSNLPAAVKLFDLAREFNLSKVLIVSSGGTVYGGSPHLPITEEYPTNPISPYGITKLAIEKYGMMFKALYDLPVIIVRPGNAYGEGQAPYSGQGFVATAIASVLDKREITLFGKSGTIRDYVHANDIAHGIMAALDTGTPGSCYNIGSGIGKSNHEIIEILRRLAESIGLDIRLRVQPQRQFDVPVNILDSKKLTHETGWTPRISLESGLERTWHWYLDNHTSTRSTG